jgi:hypothetical protein
VRRLERAVVLAVLVCVVVLAVVGLGFYGSRAGPAGSAFRRESGVWSRSASR